MCILLFIIDLNILQVVILSIKSKTTKSKTSIPDKTQDCSTVTGKFQELDKQVQSAGYPVGDDQMTFSYSRELESVHTLEHECRDVLLKVKKWSARNTRSEDHQSQLDTQTTTTTDEWNDYNYEQAGPRENTGPGKW